MTMSGIQGEQGRSVGDPVRRLVLTILAIYLAPVVLVVLLIAGLGLLCEAGIRLFHREPKLVDDRRKRRDLGAHRLAVPHFRATAASRSRG